MNAVGQLSIFDLDTARRLRDEGIALAIQNNEEWIEKARGVAEAVYHLKQRPISSDDVRAVLDPLDIKPASPAAYGGIFKNGRWEFVGWRVSRITSNHCRPIRAWRLKDAA